MKTRMIFIATMISVFCISVSSAQDLEALHIDNATEVKEQKKTKFPLSKEDLAKYIDENLEYPMDAKKNMVEGIVFAEFKVFPDGSIDNIRVSRGLGHGCEEEVVRMISEMPNWTATTGQRMNVRLPVRFKLK